MVMILNLVTFVGVAIGFMFDCFGKKCLFPMIIGLCSQIIVLVFVVFIGYLLYTDNADTAGIILEIASSPKDVISVLKTMM